MTGDLIIPVGKRLLFHTNGDFGYYLLDNGEKLQILDHDGHMLLQFGYNSVPETVGGVPLATAAELAGKADVNQATQFLYAQGEQIDNASYFPAYICDVLMADNQWYHLIHLPHRNMNGYASQIRMTFGVDPVIQIRGAEGPYWGEWHPLATATPPEEHSAAIATGLIGTCYYRMNQFQELKLSGDVGNPNGFPPDSDIILAVLPIGCRPVRDTTVNASSRQVGSLIGQHANVSVLTNGEIHYYSTSAPGYIVVISDSFYTA